MIQNPGPTAGPLGLLGVSTVPRSSWGSFLASNVVNPPPKDEHPVCPTCNGCGVVGYYMTGGPTHTTAFQEPTYYPCPQCNGTGKLPCRCETCKKARRER